MKKFLTDEEMEKLAAGESAIAPKKFISDEEMAKLETAQPERKPPTGIMAIPGDIDKNAQQFTDVWTKDQNPVSKVWQTAGLVGKTAGGIIGRGIETAMPVIEPILEGAAYVGAADRHEMAQRIETAAATKPPIMSQVAQSPTGQAVMGTVQQFQQDNPELSANIGAGLNILGGMTIGKVSAKAAPVVPEIGNMAKKAVSATGDAMIEGAGRIQGTKVKINMPEMKKGAANKAYTDFDVFGDAKNVQKQWNDKITTDAEKLKTILSDAAPNPQNNTSIKTALAEARKTATAGKSKKEIGEISRAFDDFENEIKLDYGDDLSEINILEAQKLKQYVGKKGDWLEHNGKMTGNTKASLDGKVNNAFYNALKTDIETADPAIKEINTRLSKMIPMEKAAAKQVLVANRKNPISLDDFLGGMHALSSAGSGNLAPAALLGANIISKSPFTAKGLNSIGKVLSGKGKAVAEAIPPETPAIALPEAVESPAFARAGISPDKQIAGENAVNAAEDAKNSAVNAAQKANTGMYYEDMKKAIGEVTPKVTPQQDAAQAMRDYMAGRGNRWSSQRGAVGGENPQIHTDNFKKWFGDWKANPEQASKVVDAEGKPMVVYHGGPKGINVFDYNKIGEHGRSEGAGFYFTNNKDVAAGYGNDGKTYATYLDLKNPMPYDRKQFTPQQVRSIINNVLAEQEKNGVSIRDGFLSNFGGVDYEGKSKVLAEAVNSFMGDESALDQISSFVGSGVDPKTVNSAVFKATKYDGIVSNGFSNQGKGDTKIYTAFFPNQIKSATGNSGAFSASIPDIRGSGAVPIMASTAAAGAGLATLAGIVHNKNKKR